MLELREPRQRFVFTGVEEAPLLSLGRGFSAPALFRAPLKARDRAILMGADSDDFNRWEAGQALAAEIVLEEALSGDYLKALDAVLAKAGSDPAFAAQMLTPPGESELAARRAPADPEKLHAGRTGLIRAVAAALARGWARFTNRCARRANFIPTPDRRGGAPCAMPACAISPPLTMKQPPASPTRITRAPPT